MGAPDRATLAVAMDDDGSVPSPGEFVRRLPLSWWLPLPAVLAHALGGYVAVGLTGEGAWNGGRGVRPPTTGETVVARAVMRGLCLVVLYLSAFSLVRSYVFG